MASPAWDGVSVVVFCDFRNRPPLHLKVDCVTMYGRMIMNGILLYYKLNLLSNDILLNYISLNTIRIFTMFSTGHFFFDQVYMD